MSTRGGIDAVATSEVLVVGAGVAGLAAALGSAPRRVTLLTKAGFGQGGSSVWAQGGVAAAVGPDDAPALHAADTLAAGAGLNDREVVELLTREGPRRVAQLAALGARFDQDDTGRLELGREAAHSRRRILHAHGDATGAEMVRALTAAVAREPRIEVVERALALDLVLQDGAVAGLLARHADGRVVLHLAPAVVLATGGSGRVFLNSTNPEEATGDGLAMAARAGARLVDLEFVQFHPTALAVDGSPGEPLPLLTEALRGEGAVLLDENGRRFMPDEHPDAELAPRDVVARAIWRRLGPGRRVVLDARQAVGGHFPERFPTVWALCRGRGLDPRTEPIPVAPAAHYHMGGIAVDAMGRTSLPGLWACGEVAATGAHGANRLASNSLLEALVFGARVAEDLAGRTGRPRAAVRPESVPAAPMAREDGERALAVRRLMWEEVGLVRSEAGLRRALAALERLAAPAAPSAIGAETGNLLTVARLIATAALWRRESRGSHFRTDHPLPDPRWERRLYLTAGPAGTAVEAVEEQVAPEVAVGV